MCNCCLKRERSFYLFEKKNYCFVENHTSQMENARPKHLFKLRNVYYSPYSCILQIFVNQSSEGIGITDSIHSLYVLYQAVFCFFALISR